MINTPKKKKNIPSCLEPCHHFASSGPMMVRAVSGHVVVLVFWHVEGGGVGVLILVKIIIEKKRRKEKKNKALPSFGPSSCVLARSWSARAKKRPELNEKKLVSKLEVGKKKSYLPKWWLSWWWMDWFGGNGDSSSQALAGIVVGGSCLYIVYIRISAYIPKRD